MKTFTFVLIAFSIVLLSCKQQDTGFRSIAPEVLKDKIAGGWAGKMIGVTYGAPTEFHALGKLFEDSIKWKPADIKGSIWQDDLYVQLTFLMSMDQYGIDAPAKKYQEMFAKAGYQLWHANVQARKNYFDSIFPPLSGSPEYNYHADDIDFQIESDYIGFMCPGMPQQVVKLCDKIGHIMNYGDGLYGGIFVAALYSEAFFENDISKVIDHALKSIPSESDYYKIVKDVIALHQKNPGDWKATWKEIEAKWGNVDICGAGVPFNIDAKLNGAYIVMGLLYGEGDPYKTLEIATRCGQDSDCNPSNALAVLGVIKGFSKLPQEMQKGINDIADSVFIHTNYSYRKAVESSYKYAVDFIRSGGGDVSANAIKIKNQEPVAPTLEVSFPNMAFDRSISIFDAQAWKTKGKWETFPKGSAGGNNAQSKYTNEANAELEFSFEGTGIALIGNWVKDGGKADIYLDGKLHRSIDSYFFYSNQELYDMSLWHAFKLNQGKHTVKIVIKGEKRPESQGTTLYVSKAVVFKPAEKNLLADK
jgi:hypothetical protein